MFPIGSLRNWPDDPLFRGLWGEWRFDRRTGMVLPDSSGYGRHGTIAGAEWTATRWGAGLRFDEVRYTDYLVTSEPQLISSRSSPFSIEFFLTDGTYRNDYQCIVAQFSQPGDGWMLAWGDANAPSDSSVGLLFDWDEHWSDTGYVQAGEAVHGIVSSDGSDLRFFRNGELHGSPITITAGALTMGADLRMGFPENADGNYRGLDATLMIVRLWTRALFVAEARQLCQRAKARGSGAAAIWIIPFIPSAVGPVTEDVYLTLAASRAVAQAGEAQAGGAVSLAASRAVAQGGEAQAGGVLTLAASRAIAQGRQAQVDRSLSLALGQGIAQSGEAQAGGGLALALGQALAQAGEAQAGSALALALGQAIAQAGEAQAGGALALALEQAIAQGGEAQAGGALTLAAGRGIAIFTGAVHDGALTLAAYQGLSASGQADALGEVSLGRALGVGAAAAATAEGALALALELALGQAGAAAAEAEVTVAVYQGLTMAVVEVVISAARTWTVPAENRTFSVEAEDRIFVVAAESRTLMVQE